MLQLLSEEQAWLDAYREALSKKHPGTVQEMLIYGSKARGQAHDESDVDVILIVKDEAGARKRELRRIGYLLAAKTEVLPSILAYTKKSGIAGSEAARAFVRRSSVMAYESYEPKPGIGGVDRARQSLQAAETLTGDGLYADAISRAYYSILHAAKAALHVHDIV